MLEDTIEILTKQMIEDAFKNSKSNVTEIAVISKTDLYNFCIKLINLLKELEERYE